MGKAEIFVSKGIKSLQREVVEKLIYTTFFDHFEFEAKIT
jgi:hypothetical protein